MNKRITAALTLSALSVIAVSCNFHFSSARIADAKMTKGVSEKMEAINPTDTFETTEPIVHCLVVLANAPKNTQVKAVWKVVSAEGQKPGDKFGEKVVEAGDSMNAIDFTYAPPPAGFPVGEYKVDVYLNPQPGKEELPTKSVTFSVRSSGAVITKATVSGIEDGDSMTQFPAGTEAFYCQVGLRGAAAGSTVTAIWVAVEAEATQPNSEIRRTPIVLEAGQNMVRFNLTYDRGFPPGRYRVDIYTGDSAAAAKSLTFSVAE